MYVHDTTYVEGGLAGNIEDDEDPTMGTGLDHEVPTPEANDNYVNALEMLPRRNSYSREKVIGKKRDVDENTVGRSNNNQILTQGNIVLSLMIARSAN